jgi:hypothetical protein
MKIGLTSIRLLSVFILFGLLVRVFPCIGTQEDQVNFSFDSIFPTTPYKDALGSCMQVLGYLDQLCHEHQRGEQIAFCLVHDAFLGKVVHAEHKVTHLIKNIQSGAVVADDNVRYLSAIVTYINQLYRERIDEDQRNTLVMNSLEGIAVQVSRLSES